MIGTVQTLYSEMPTTELIPLDRLDNFIEEVNALRGGQSFQATGMLSEWWQVFWNILIGNSNNNNSSNTSPAIQANTQSNGQNTNFTSNSTTGNNSSQQNLNIISSNNRTTLKVPINKDISAATKKPTVRPQLSINKKNLDVDELAAIEKSLTAVGLMNRDLTRLSGEEKTILSSALRNNRVSIDAWTAYLQLCQEYTRTGSNIATPVQNVPIAAPIQSSFPSGANVIIDQEARPVDSRHLLWLRQSLYHQYVMKNSAAVQSRSNNFTQNIGTNEVSPLLINAPQLPLESPFYSPPRKLDDFPSQMRFDPSLSSNDFSTESVSNAQPSNNVYSETTIEELPNSLGTDATDISSYLSLDFGCGDLLNAFNSSDGVSAGCSSNSAEQISEATELYHQLYPSFYESHSQPENEVSPRTTDQNNPANSDNNFTVLIPTQLQQEEDLHNLMSEFLDVNNL